jgi:hypothetical protein
MFVHLDYQPFAVDITMLNIRISYGSRMFYNGCCCFFH